MLKSILFTHDDLDGAGCRIVYELAHIKMEKGVNFNVINCSNNNIDEKVSEAINKPQYICDETEICFADIICSKEMLESLVKKFSDIKIWDHHATNFPAQQVLPSAVIEPFNDQGIPYDSGTSLIYRHYCDIAFSKTEDANYCSKAFTSSKRDGHILSKLVDTIRSYDIYEWKSTNNIDAKMLQTLFFMLGMEYFCKRYITRITENTIPSENLFEPHDLEFITIKLENEQKAIDSVTEDMVFDCDILGYKGAFLMYPIGANISEVAYQFLEKHPKYDVFASVTLARGGEFSFRTQHPDLDVGAVFAKPIGGGGHPKASGAPVPGYIIELFRDALLCHMNNCTFRYETWWETKEEGE